MSFGSSFLVEPSTAREGASWGSERVCLDIAGGTHTIGGLSGSQKETLGQLYGRFVVPDRGARPDIHIRRIGGGAFRDFDKGGWEYALDVDYGERRVRLAGIDLVADIELARALRGTLSTPADGALCHGPVENFLRIFTAYSTLERDGVFLHSAAVRMGADAVLFVGPSGAGKSTVARSASATGREVLSDDLNPVTSHAGDLFVKGSPFLGDVGSRSPVTLPLRAIYRLEKADRDRLRALSRGEAVGSLLACAPFVNHDPHRRDGLVERLSELVRAVPTYSLTFRREGTFWPLLEWEGVPDLA
jgi:hypothetical protein